MLVTVHETNAGSSAPLLVTDLPAAEESTSIFSARPNVSTENYFSIVDTAFELLLGERFCRRDSITAGSLHALRFNNRPGKIELAVTICTFCPEQTRRPTSEEVVALEAMQVNVSSLDRLDGSRDNYRMRSQEEDDGGNLNPLLGAVIRLLSSKQFAISSLTSHLGAREGAEDWTRHQLDYYLPHITGGLLVLVSWKEAYILPN